MRQPGRTRYDDDDALVTHTNTRGMVPALGDSTHGFPFLAGPGSLVVKDAIMLGAALVTMADLAKAYVQKKSKGN